DAAPVRCQLLRGRRALRADAPVEVFLDVGQLGAAAGIDQVAPAEAQRETDVHQLDQVEVAREIRAQALQDLEELRAAVGLAVESHQQGLLRPAALLAPWRIEHRL